MLFLVWLSSFTWVALALSYSLNCTYRRCLFTSRWWAKCCILIVLHLFMNISYGAYCMLCCTEMPLFNICFWKWEISGAFKGTLLIRRDDTFTTDEALSFQGGRIKTVHFIRRRQTQYFAKDEGLILLNKVYSQNCLVWQEFILWAYNSCLDVNLPACKSRSNFDFRYLLFFARTVLTCTINWIITRRYKRQQCVGWSRVTADYFTNFTSKRDLFAKFSSYWVYEKILLCQQSNLFSLP